MTGARGPVTVRAGLLRALGRELAGVVAPGPCVLVTDRTVGRLHGAVALRGLRAGGFLPVVATVPAGERSKSLEGLERVLAVMAGAGAGRDTPVLALGGGVVTDLAGFAAAVYVRGVPWVALPTTVLGLADAAVGGKTGVDLPGGKNLVGAFHAPLAVMADPAVLGTLPPRHRRNGLAEVAKTALLRGVRRGLPEVRGLAAVVGDPEGLAAAAALAATRKAAIVARDPRETRGRRVVLNLGHTLGHALETASGYDGSVLHGEGVAVGLVAAARLAVARGLLPAAAVTALAEALREIGLPVTPPAALRRGPVGRAMGLDKKRVRGSLRMVLPRWTAGPVVVPVDPAEALAAAWAG